MINILEKPIGSLSPGGAQSMLQNVSRQGAAVLVSRGALLILGLVSNIFLSRILGPTGLGRFQLGFVLVQLLTTFCVLGLDKALMRYLPLLEARAIGGRRQLFLQGTAVVTVISLIASASLFFVAPAVAKSYFHAVEMNGVLRMSCLYLPFFALARFLGGAVAAVKRVDFGSRITNIVTPAVFLAALIAVALTHTGVNGAIIARSASVIVATVLLLGFLLRRLPKDGDQSRRNGSFKGYFIFSLPLFFVGLGYLLLGQMDTIMLGHFASAPEVGIYAVAVRISAFVIVGLEIILPVVGPFWAHLDEVRDLPSRAVLFGTVTKWTSNCGLLLFALIALFRIELLRVFGREFEAGAAVVLILSLGQLANAVSGPTGQLLSMSGRQKLEMVNTVFMVVLNFFLNLFLIPRMGTTGAAIATGASIALINGIKLLQVHLIFGLQPYTIRYYKGIIAVGAGALVCYFVRMWLFRNGVGPYVIISLAGPVFLFIAAVGFWLLGLDEDDRLGLSALRGR